MTQATPPPAKDEKSTKDEGKGITAGTLRQMIREEVGNIAGSLMPGGGSTKDTPAPGSQAAATSDIKSQVAEALAQLKSKEDRQARDAEVDAMLAEYKKPKEEVIPVERRRVERIMGWGD